MNALHVAVTGLTIVANAFATGADIVRAKFVVKTAVEVHAPLWWLPYLAALKAAGAVGLVAGLFFGVPFIETAAAFGLVLFFVAAIIAHVRARSLLQHCLSGAVPVLGRGIAHPVNQKIIP